VLADAAREHQRVEASERRGHRRDPAGEPMRVDVEGQPAALVSLVDPGQDLAHVA
jgi:hypothetical protein